MSGDHNMYASGSGDGQRSGWRKRTIMEMALKAGFTLQRDERLFVDLLEAFANLVREEAQAEEREACAKVCEDSWMAFSRTPNRRLDITPFPELEYVAKVIRARGDKHD